MDVSAQEVETAILNKLSHQAAHDLQGFSSNGEDVVRSGTAGREENPGTLENYSLKILTSRDQIHTIVQATSSEPHKEYRMSFVKKESAVIATAAVIDDLINHLG